MNTYFISGHGNISLQEFIDNYIPQIDHAIKEKSHFILGDFRGTDTLAMEYLKDKTSYVTIYHCFKKPRYIPDKFDTFVDNWKIIGGFQSDDERDIAMTNNATHDIALIKVGRENSGTAKNILRRQINK